MSAIEKAKDYLGRVIAEECAKEDWDGVVLVYAREALAALEAEKPAEDALELASKIEHGAHDYAKFWRRVLPQWLQSYAEAYHAKKCAECKKVEPRKYYPLGQEPMRITTEASHA